MCDSDLSAPPVSGPTKQQQQECIVKLSFRAGTHTEFHQALKTALSQKAWLLNSDIHSSHSKLTSSPFQPRMGISGIMKTVDDNNKKTNDTLKEAFGDIDNLFSKAAEMGKLAEGISSKLSSSSILKNSGNEKDVESSDLLEFRKCCYELGLSMAGAPVTKDISGDSYHLDLSNQIASFLSSLIQKHGGQISLVDLYCMFNRARGVNLVSPSDFQKAVEQLKGYKIKKYASGVLSVQSTSFTDEMWTQKVVECCRSEEKGKWVGLSPFQFAEKIKISIILAQEILLVVFQY